MYPRRFTEPLGSRLTALEQNIIKFRAMQIALVMFYAEELKREILNLIQTTGELQMALMERNAPPERVPKGSNNAVKRALNALVADSAIATDEKKEIVRLIDYRNDIAHEIHNLFIDLSADRFAHRMFISTPDLLKQYDYDAVERLRYFIEKLRDLHKTHHYVMTARFEHLVFKSAERILLGEIKRLRHKIDRLYNARRRDIDALNKELLLEGTELEGERHPMHPLNRYEDGRLTKRGIEICYRLFDIGKSSMAVAQLMGLSLDSSRKRKVMWTALGGIDRVSVDIEACPRRRFYRLRDW